MHRRTLNLGWLWLLSSFVVACLPVQAQVVPDATLGAGKNSVTTTTGDRTDITGGLRRSSALFHSFDRFSIDTNRQVYFANPTGIRNIFSRVTGSSVSNIDGLLGVSGKANLFLMNPNGIIFGPNARLDVAGSFLATTANVLEFADGQRFAADGDRAVPLVEVNIPIGLQVAANSPAMLNNQGNLAVGTGQSLTLAGGNTTHTGSLTAPGGTVQVLGNQVTLADQARVDVSSPTGGGTALIGGDYQGRGSLLNSTQTVVGSGVTINANATTQGNGGKVIVWADGDTRFSGSITAQGGTQGGNGGFVEVSGKQRLAFQGQVDTRAFQGQAGTLLLDPANITIANSGTDPIPQPTDPGDFVINPAALQTALNTGAIVLQADTSIVITDAIDSSGNANANALRFFAPAIGLNASVTTKGDQIYDGAVTLGTTATLTSNNGNVNFNNTANSAASAGHSLTIAAGTGDVTFSNAVGGAANGALGAVNVAGGAISLNGNVTTTGNQTYNGAVTLAAPTTLTGGTIGFGNTVNGGQSLGITGNANFGGAVGNTTSLISLDVSGNTTLNGNITTTGDQTYMGPVTLNANTTLVGGTIDFGSTVNGGRTLGITGNAAFGGAVGNATRLTSLNVSGSTQISGGSVRTTGNQTYNNAVTLASNTQLDSNNGNITLNQVDGASGVTAPLTVTTTGDVSLNRAVGSIQPLGAVNVSGDQIAVTGTASIRTVDGSNITLNGGTVSVSGGSLTAGSVSATGGQVSLTGSRQVLLTGNGSIQARSAAIGSATLPLIKDSNFTINTFVPFTLPPDTIPFSPGSTYTYTNINVFNDTDGTAGLSPLFSPALLSLLQLFDPVAFNQLQQSQLYFSPSTLWIPSVTLNAFPGSQTVSLTASNNIAINSTTPVNLNFPSGSGSILFSATNSFSMNSVDRIRTNGRNISINASSLNVGNGGGIRPVNPASNIDASLPIGFSGAGGIVTLTGTAINLTNSRISTDARGIASGGAIVLNSTGTIIANNTFLDSSTFGSQQGGTVSLRAPTVTLLNNSQVSASVQPGTTGRGGDVVVNANQVNLTDSSLRADTAGTGSLINANQGKGGNITVNVNTLTSAGANSGLFATTTSSASAGSISFQPQSGVNLAIDLSNGATVSASTSSGGIGGNIDITVPQSVTISGNGTLRAETSGGGNAGSVTIQTPILNVSSTTISTAATAAAPALPVGTDPAGAITLRPFAVGSTETLTVNLSNGANITASTAGARQSGSIDISAPQSVTISGNGTLRAETAGSGNAGSVDIRTATLNVTGSTISTGATATATALPANAAPGGRITLQPVDTSSTATLAVNLADKATITASTAGARSGGSISVTAPQSVTLSGSGSLRAETSGSGNAGEVRIATPDLTLQNGVQLSTSTTGTGQGGSILIGAATPDPNVLTFANSVSLNNSRLDAQTNGAGTGGNIDIQAQTISLTNNSLLNAGVLNTGNGGTIALDTNGGTIALDNSQISTAIESTGTGSGNTITVNTATLSLVNGARIQSQTSGTGNAGDVQINVDTALTASGSNSFGRFSGILASSENPASGRGGDITINDAATPRGQVTLSNNAFLAANTRSSNDSGNITLNVENLDLRSGGQVLTAASETSSGRAGSITVNATGQVSISDAAAPPTTTSPFAALTVINLADANFQVSNNANVLNSTTVPFQLASAPVGGGFAYYGFNVAAGNSQGTFDIDGGYKLGAGSIDTQIFLFDRTTGNLLASSDDSTVDPGSTPVFGSFTFDSFINHTFSQPGAYVIGVGAFPSSVAGGTAPIAGTAPVAGQTYTVNLSLTSPGTGGATNPINLNPNLPLDNGLLLLASGLYASSKGTGAAGSVTVITPNLTLDNQGTIAASNVSSTGQDISLQGLNSLTVSGNSQITASTRTGTAGNVTIVANQGSNPAITLNNSQIAAAATQAGGQAGGIAITTPTLALTDATIAASNINAATGGNVTFNNLDTLTTLNSVVSASTQSGVAGGVSINDGQPAARSVTLSGTRTAGGSQGSIIATATSGGNAGSVSINTTTLDATNGASIAASSANGAGTAGGVDITATTVNLMNAEISAETDAGGTSSPADITLQGLQRLNVNNGQISSSTNSGVAGNVTVNATEQVNLNGSTGRIAAEARQGGNAGSVSITAPTVEINNGAAIAVSSANGSGTAGGVNIAATTVNLNNAAQISAETDAGGATSPANITLQGLQNLNVNNSQISSSTNSGQAGSVTVNAAQQVNLDNNGRIAAEARQGGSAGSVSITTPNVEINNGASIAASSRSGVGRAGGVDITAATVNLNNGAQISAETDAGGANSPANITLQGLQRLKVNNSLISSSTNSGGAGSVTVNAPTGQVTLNGNNSGIIAEARQGGSAGNVDITAGKLLIQNGARAAVSSPNGQAGNLSVRANSIRLDRGTLSAETATGGNGANISITTQQPFLLRHESLISASAGQQANGGTIQISTPFLIGLSFENSDIIANSVRGRGGTINITTNAIFGLAFRPKLTPRSDITASSEFGVSGNVTINSLNLDPSRGLTQLPTDLVDRTSQIAQGCSVGGSSAEKESRFTIAGRGGVQLSPTALLPAQASTSDWVGLDGPAVIAAEPRFPDGSLLVLRPGQTYQVQTVCVNSWKNQQRSSL